MYKMILPIEMTSVSSLFLFSSVLHRKLCRKISEIYFLLGILSKPKKEPADLLWLFMLLSLHNL